MGIFAKKNFLHLAVLKMIFIKESRLFLLPPSLSFSLSWGLKDVSSKLNVVGAQITNEFYTSLHFRID